MADQLVQNGPTSIGNIGKILESGGHHRPMRIRVKSVDSTSLACMARNV